MKKRKRIISYLLIILCLADTFAFADCAEVENIAPVEEVCLSITQSEENAGSASLPLPEGEPQAAAEDSVFEESAAAAGVSNVVYEPCEYSPGFNKLTFDITGDGGTKFTCLITGLKEKEGGRPVTQEGCEELAEIISMVFLNSSSGYNVTDDSQYSPVDLVPIDAEKYSINLSSKGTYEENGYPAGDAELCWAASASNMLTYAGWLTDEFNNEDELFTEITKSFFDIAGNEVYAFDWYMDGVNPIQDAVIDETGDVAVSFTEKYVGINGAQLKEKESGRYLPEYAASSTSSYIRVENLGAAAVSDYLTDNLDEGNAVGISFRHVTREDFADYGGHAIGVFGYIKEKLCEAGAALRALFVSNSDDNASEDPTVIFNPEDTEEIRKTTVNNYAMKRVSICVDPGERDMIDMMMSGDDMYSPIFDVSTLTPKKLCEDSKETTGTMDSRSDFNMVPTWIGIVNDGTFNPDEPIFAGDVLTFWSETEDKSYKFFSSSETPYLEYSYEIYKDGQFYKSIELETEIFQFNPEPGFPAKANSKSTHSDFSYTFYEPGEYKVKLVVNGLYSVESGIRKDLKEAYTTDNDLDKFVTFTVLPKKNQPVVPTEETVSTIVPRERSVSRKIFCGMCVLKNATDGLGIVFDCSCNGFRELIREDKPVDQGYYSVSVSDTGRYILTLTREYLGILGAGVHYLHLETDCESVCFKVTIL